MKFIQLQKLLNPAPTAKNSTFGSQKVKKDPKIKSNSKVIFERI